MNADTDDRLIAALEDKVQALKAENGLLTDEVSRLNAEASRHDDQIRRVCDEANEQIADTAELDDAREKAARICIDLWNDYTPGSVANTLERTEREVVNQRENVRELKEGTTF